MSDLFITITQALQLVALVPTIFVIAFLLCVSKRDGKNMVAVLYFLALGCQFVIPLLPLWTSVDGMALWHGSLMMGGSLIPALSFLLIIQFLKGYVPPALYWLVLAVPIIGGAPFIYASLQAHEICLDQDYCVVTDNLRVLYDIIGTLLIFLLIIVYIARTSVRLDAADRDRSHKYWLILSLVFLNLAMVGVNLFILYQGQASVNALFVGTIIRIGFIYLMLTSIFRLFYDLFDVTIPDGKGGVHSVHSLETDKRIIAELDDLIAQQHIYREMGLSRKSLADQLQVSEHQLSRVINMHYQKNFHELMNFHRVEEAKKRLRNESTQITVIAFEVGFNSIASFNRVFKELADRSPSEYRAFKRVE